jgi:hypothetical protein
MNTYVAEKAVTLGQLQKALATNGEKGWELVTVVSEHGGLYVAIWKVPPEKKTKIGAF